MFLNESFMSQIKWASYKMSQVLNTLQHFCVGTQGEVALSFLKSRGKSFHISLGTFLRNA